MNRNKNNQKFQYPIFYDIGGRGGLHRSLHKFPLFFKYLSFEPDKAEALNLKKKFKKNKNFESFVYNFALDKKKIIKKFYIYSSKPNSSLLKINKKLINRNKKIKISKTLKIHCYSIDHLIKFKKFDIPNFISIDTEGSELNILKGTKQNLNQIIGVRCESSLQKNYQGGSTFNEINLFLERYGFSLIRVETCNAGFTGFTTDMNRFSINPFDAKPNMADFIYYNKKYLDILIKKKDKLSNSKTFFFILWTIYNGCGYIGLEYLSKVNKSFFQFLRSNSKFKNIFFMVLISYLKIKRSKFNRKQNYKKIFNQITGENLKTSINI